MTKFSGLGYYIPQFEALMRGIDLEELKKEKFNSPEHEKLVAIHRERVRKYEQSVRFRNLSDKLAAIEAEHLSKWKARKAKTKALAEAREQDFPEHLIAIALRSLEKNGR